MNDTLVATRKDVEQICLETMREQLAEFSQFEYLRNELAKIYDGRSIVCPTSEDHARDMIRMGEFYLSQHHAETFKALKKEYNE
jgi:hypothetical protein